LSDLLQELAGCEVKSFVGS